MDIQDCVKIKWRIKIGIEHADEIPEHWWKKSSEDSIHAYICLSDTKPPWTIAWNGFTAFTFRSSCNCTINSNPFTGLVILTKQAQLSLLFTIESK